MSPELVNRFLVVGIVVVLVLLTTAYLRRRDRLPMRRLGRVDLDRGVYLLTSTQCLDCVTARELLLAELGEGGFVELSWENDRDTLDRYRIEAVPATLVVDADRNGRVWFGKPPRAILTRDP